MSDLTDPLLPDTIQNNQNINKHNVSLGKFLSVALLTFTLFLLFIIILAAQLPPENTMARTTVGADQGTGWFRTIYGEYRVFTQQCQDGCDFDTAVAICEAENSHLPYIMSQEENDEIKNLLTGTPISAWVGLHSKFRKESWQLHNTEEAATYFNFAGDDNDNDSDARCATIDEDNEGKWRRTGCMDTKGRNKGSIGVVCQRLPASMTGVDKRVMMGKSACDDGQKGIEKDLKNMEYDTSCDKKFDAQDRKVFLKEGRETNKKFCEEVHEKYVPNHICMKDNVSYTGFGAIPTHGPHRPNWASFGEYSYCPPERYQHNIEHGCIIMLYHPCMDQNQVSIIKKLVSSCLRKHIITPSRLPSLQNPVILVAWGCYQELQFLDLDTVKQFVTQQGLKGPEGNYTKDGLYTHLQVAKAAGEENKILC